MNNEKDINAKISDLKNQDLTNSVVNLWIINHYYRGSDAHYNLLAIDIEKKLSGKLKNIILNKINNLNQIKDYEYITSDQDESILTLNYKETDFSKIFDELQKGSDIKKVEKREDLSKAWAYLIELKGVVESRAAFWGRDQISKIAGDINESLQTSTGFPGYIWMTQLDGRVRDSHADLHGRYFTWQGGSDEGNPGDPPNCRCYAQPANSDADALSDDEIEADIGKIDRMKKAMDE